MKKFFTLFFCSLLVLLISTSIKAQNIYWGTGEGFTNNPGRVNSNSLLIPPNAPAADTADHGVWILYNAYRTSSSTSACPVYESGHIRFPKVVEESWASTPDLGFGVNTISFANANTTIGKVFTLQYTTGQYNDTAAYAIQAATWTQFAKFKISNTACEDTTITLNNSAARRIRWFIDSTVAYQTDFDSVLITSTSTITPVKFSGISANYNNGIVKVAWNNETENTSTYEIERSVDGKTFNSIGSVKAINTRSYAWIDNSPVSGNGFYRIKAIDENGTISYSSIVKINTGNKLAEVVIAPNPVRGKNLIMQLNNLAKGNYTLNIFNSASQRVFNSTVSHAGGNSVQTLSLPASVTKGLYNVHITNGISSFSKTIIVE